MQITSPKAGRFIHMYGRWSYTIHCIYRKIGETEEKFIQDGDFFVALLLSTLYLFALSQ